VPLIDALNELRTVRGSGHPWTTTDIEGRLAAAGYVAVEAVSPLKPVQFVLGRKPE
jgi:hypothetical protein